MKRISLLFILILLSCNKQESKGHLRNNKEINSLKNAPYNITDEGDGTKSNYDDLSPEFIRTEKKILDQRKFQFPDENTFNHKVAEVFSINLKEYSNPIIALRLSMFPEVAIRKDQFIFIQDANANEPEFINPDLLYHFNSYVFYNTPVSYIWLQSNSPNLLYDLVAHYGYNKDKKLTNTKVLEGNANCPDISLDNIALKNNYFTIEKYNCTDKFYLKEYITFKFDKDLLLHKYSIEFTDRHDPDKSIPNKNYTSKDLGNVKFENVDREFLINLLNK
ncbi:hypothetical protein H5J24_14860 [Chryseobacterium capnotolerans]|uniref:hypothetical protein n=1 Tax=Chryseobacterium TaxID=59732 RepID=UPI000839EBFE|nr:MULTISPECIES: hypothetical protein [Chryseobacterium]UHO37038.1 hypothetical protein H5J24_14860 [Chryseobacterium capnotolerans]